MKTLLYASAILSSLIAGALAAPQAAAPPASRASPFVIPPLPQPVVTPQPAISPAVPLDVTPPAGVIAPAVPIDPALTPGTTAQQAATDANAANLATTPQTTAQTAPQTTTQTTPQTTMQTPTQTVPQTVNPSVASRLGIPTVNPTPQNQAQAASVTPNSVTPAFLNLSGTPLTDSRGHPIGSVQQLVLNQAGNINIAVVNTGGRLVPIPWKLIGACNVPGRPGLMVNMDQAALSQAPSMTMNQMPLLTQEATLDQIFRCFGLTPGSVMTASTTTAHGSATANGATITGGATSSP